MNAPARRRTTFNDAVEQLSNPVSQASGKQSPPPPRDRCLCIAYGCPNLGTLSTSTQGSDGYVCWAHFGKAATDWAQITTRERERKANPQPRERVMSPTVREMHERIDARRQRLQRRPAGREPGQEG